MNDLTDQLLKVFSKQHHVLEFRKLKIFETSVLDIRQDSSHDVL